MLKLWRFCIDVWWTVHLFSFMFTRRFSWGFNVGITAFSKVNSGYHLKLWRLTFFIYRFHVLPPFISNAVTVGSIMSACNEMSLAFVRWNALGLGSNALYQVTQNIKIKLCFSLTNTIWNSIRGVESTLWRYVAWSPGVLVPGTR
jgi:hypothetical protein